MEDFNGYVENNGRKNGGLFDTVKSVAEKFDGKSEADLFKAVMDEAKRKKAAGTLTDADVDNFVAAISPMLDVKKRKILLKIAEKIKSV